MTAILYINDVEVDVSNPTDCVAKAFASIKTLSKMSSNSSAILPATSPCKDANDSTRHCNNPSAA